MQSNFDKVLEGKSQFGIGPFGINKPDDSLEVSFTPLTYTLDIILLVNKPRPLEPFLNFLKPFPGTMWLLLAIFLILGTVVFHFLNETHDNLQTAILHMLATQVSQGEIVQFYNDCCNKWKGFTS